MGASNEKGDAKGSVEEGGKMVRARWSGVTKWEGVGWIAGRNESISKCDWQIAGLALGLLHIPYESKAKRWKKTSLLPLVTSFCDKTLFKPTASPSTGSGGPCNEHKQKAKSCALKNEIWMFHCFTLTISRINTSNALCFSDTQWQKLWQWWGSKMSLNHVEPCWTMLNHVEPFHFATQLLTAWKDLVQTLHLPRQLQPQVTLQIPPPAERKKVLEGSEGIAMPKLDMSRWPCTASTPTRPSTFFE